MAGGVGKFQDVALSFVRNIGGEGKKKKKKGNVTKIMKIVNYEREKETSSKFLIALEQFVIIKVFAV